MPVIRISQETWATLKAQATPLEDTANDVVNLALDALELASTKGPAGSPAGRNVAESAN